MPHSIREISVGFCPNSCLPVSAPALSSLSKIYILSFLLFIGHVFYLRLQERPAIYCWDELKPLATSSFKGKSHGLLVSGRCYPRPKTCFNFFSSLPRTLVGTLRALILPFDLPAFKCLAKPRRRKSLPVPVIFILRLIDFLIFSFLFFTFCFFLPSFYRSYGH